MKLKLNLPCLIPLCGQTCRWFQDLQVVCRLVVNVTQPLKKPILIPRAVGSMGEILQSSRRLGPLQGNVSRSISYAGQIFSAISRQFGRVV